MKLLEVVVDPIEPVVHRPLEPGHPVVHGAELLGSQAVQPVPTLCSTPDQSDLAQHPEMFGDLRLRHREVAHDRADRLLAGHQHVEDLASVAVRYGVEDV